MSNRIPIDISFLGGASSIGASCTLVRFGDTTLVIDCGIRYSGSSPLPDLASLAETSIDAVLLTHAHMDHSGGLPVLAEACPGAPVFATPPTIDLIGILLRDSLRLMNSPDRESEVPLYTEQQVEQLLRRLADQGRTVILITHATKNVVLADKVVLLAHGGHLDRRRRDGFWPLFWNVRFFRHQGFGQPLYRSLGIGGGHSDLVGSI